MRCSHIDHLRQDLSALKVLRPTQPSHPQDDFLSTTFHRPSWPSKFEAYLAFSSTRCSLVDHFPQALLALKGSEVYSFFSSLENHSLLHHLPRALSIVKGLKPTLPSPLQDACNTPPITLTRRGGYCEETIPNVLCWEWESKVSLFSFFWGGVPFPSGPIFQDYYMFSRSCCWRMQ